jgi:hypothetical protein
LARRLIMDLVCMVISNKYSTWQPAVSAQISSLSRCRACIRQRTPHQRTTCPMRGPEVSRDSRTVLRRRM